MRVGPGTRVIFSYELTGPMNIVVRSSEGQSVQMLFEQIDKQLGAQLLGKEPGSYSAVIAGTEDLREHLVQAGIPLEITVDRSALPSEVQLGKGFTNQDEVGRELPMVVTRIDGARITLSKVACRFSYIIEEVKPR